MSTSVSTPSASPPALRAKDDRVKTRSLTSRLLSRPEIGSLIGAIAVFVLFVVVAPTFRQPASLATVAYAGSTIGIMAVAVALLMIGGEFDLSAGVVVTTSALAASTFAYQLRLNLWVGILVSLLLALAIGAFNGWLLMRTGLPSFLITLGTFFMLQGLNLGVTKLLTGGVSSDSVADMDGFASAQAVFASTIQVGGVGVRITVLWWILFVALATWTLLRTRVGNWIFAVGGDDAAARAVGVPVRKTKIGLFMTVGFCGWFVGMHQLFSFDSIQSGGGVGQEFIYIIAAVVGGCLLTGGYGSAVGSAIGALIFGMTSLGIVYAGWDANWFKLFLGVMLLLATIVNLVVKNQAAKR
ncbi:ABC transporter permease [Kineococcus indalonis]|uniref:ABC transporter permease n=1 Tax=Kineococcus indalonis TaxID=2696566 RepID=UPI0014130A02|nr:ABC transporter permease [Kineococcus indalonis]NAZ85487.1 ABC transporter permease [Kineococcus indalonis]